jgi:hypothetical protein
MQHRASPEDIHVRVAFVNQSDACASYADLVRINPLLLDSTIMLTHYSADLLFSPAARQAFVEPNIQRIPPSAMAIHHGDQGECGSVRTPRDLIPRLRAYRGVRIH